MGKVFTTKWRIVNGDEAEIEAVQVNETDCYVTLKYSDGRLRRYHKASYFGRTKEYFDSPKAAYAAIRKGLTQRIKWAKNDIKRRSKYIKDSEKVIAKVMTKSRGN